jgi:F-type H+-transporting ATPase subunit gamma
MAGSSIRDIKRRIRSVKSIEKITNAMKLVSAAKLRQTRNAFEKTHEALEFITDKMDELCSRADEIPSRYVAGSRDIKRACYIVVTSNRGLAGSYNANIIKAVEKEMQDDQEKPIFVCIGGKGLKHFSKRGYEILTENSEPPEKISFEITQEIIDQVIELYDNEIIDEVFVVYTKFISTIEQHPVTDRLLPFVHVTEESKQSMIKLPEYEPSPTEVFDYLVKKYVEIMTFRILIEAATCEHAARRIAMQNATDNAHEMTDELELFFNRARQAAITSEITEIVSGADAIKD